MTFDKRKQVAGWLTIATGLGLLIVPYIIIGIPHGHDVVHAINTGAIAIGIIIFGVTLRKL